MLSRNEPWALQLGEHVLLTPGKWLWLRSLIWAAVLFAGAILFFFSSLMLGHWLHLPERSDYAIALIVPALAFGAYSLAIRKGEGRIATEVMPTGSTIRQLLAGAAIGFSMLVAILALLWALSLYHVQANHWTDQLHSFLFDSYISGMLEELAFRVILLRLFSRSFGPLWGLTLSSLLFGVAHLSHATLLQAFEVAFNGGLILGLLYMVTGRIWMSVGMHIAWDFTEESILGVNSHSGLLLSTPVTGRSDILTGGKYGPDGSALAAVVGVVLIALIVYANSKGVFRSKTLC
jgi:membrane protease YdiL (CAAX protease family)